MNDTHSERVPVKILKQTPEFQKWYQKLKNPIAKAHIAMRLARIEFDGHMGDIKPVGQGISELRIHIQAGYRVYLKQHGDILIILLCAGDKDSQEDDVKLAKLLWLREQEQFDDFDES